jgi:hypothetical protein
MPATLQAPPQEQVGVIEPFTNEGGEGWLSNVGGTGLLAYTGSIVAGQAEGHGTVRCAAGDLQGFTIYALFRAGAMLPCPAVVVLDNGDAFSGPLAVSGLPADGARGAFLRGADGGRFQGSWPAWGVPAGQWWFGNHWFWPLHGTAWVASDGSVHAVALDGTEDIFSGGDGWRPGGPGWVRLGVLTGPAGQVGLALRPWPPASAQALPTDQAWPNRPDPTAQV